jgi:hypothetical protein
MSFRQYCGLLCGSGINDYKNIDMKKILIFVLFIVSCDTIGYNNYKLVNNCNEDITVSVILFDDKTINFNIKAKSEYFFYQSEGISHTNIRIVELAFKQIVITKNGNISQKNYIDKEKWRYIDIDDTHREWSLSVNPEDFETK